MDARSAARAAYTDPEYHFPETVAVKKRFIIGFSPRSGSNYLSSLCWRTGMLGAPAEYFNYDASMFSVIQTSGVNNISEFVNWLEARRTSPNGVFGTKLLPGHHDMIRNSRAWDWPLSAEYILTFRRDMVAQAVSHSFATQTGQWQWQMPIRNLPKYDFESILESAKHIQSIADYWSGHMRTSGGKALVLWYEDIVARPRDVIAIVARYLNVSIEGAKTPARVPVFEKQVHPDKDEWRARFTQDCRARSIPLPQLLFHGAPAPQTAPNR